MAAVLRRVPDNPSRTLPILYDQLCEAGQELFSAWWEEMAGWLELQRGRGRRQFLADDQLADDQVPFELRAATIMAMPPDAWVAWLKLPEARRHAQLVALEAGQARPSRADPPDHSRPARHAEPQRPHRRLLSTDPEDDTGPSHAPRATPPHFRPGGARRR